MSTTSTDVGGSTANEIARRLGVSPNTVYRWVREKRITAVRVGPRMLRIDPDSVDSLVRPAMNTADMAPPQTVPATPVEEHIERVLRDAPPLTEEQCQRIAALLLTGSRVSGAA